MRRILLFTILIMSAEAAVRIERTAYAGWPNCYRISNGDVELIVTTDIGPRVIRYGFVGGQNLFKEFKEQLGKSGEKEWMPRGGHRVWMSPEDLKLSYALDNGPVQVKVNGDTIELTQPVEPETGLQKQMVVKLTATGSQVQVINRMKNTAAKPREFAVWALTMMAQGGTAFTGFPPRGKHPIVVAPTNPLVMWAYTDFSDPRWKFTKKYLMLRQDPKNSVPQKTGHYNQNTFGAYLLGSDLFIKQYTPEAGKSYPDFGCSFETFTNGDFLEIETVGPLRTMKQGETADHIERWSLHRNVKIASWTDDELDRVVLPLLPR